MKLSYKPSSHIPVLDGIRGLAILLVLIFHFLSSYTKIAKVGWIGVDLFFVLSGFLITGILLDSKEKENYFKSFIVRRILRIFPLYYLSLVLFFIIIPSVYNTDRIESVDYLVRNQAYFWAYCQNWLASFDSNWPLGNPLSHFWSLAIEEQYYLIWPWIIYYTDKRFIGRVCLTLILFALGFRVTLILLDFPWVTAYVNTLARFDTLAMGSLLALLIRQKPEILEKNAQLWFIVSGIALLAVFGFAGGVGFNRPLMQSIGFTLLGLFFASMIPMALSKDHLLNKIFDNLILRKLGKYAYGLYVYHTILIRMFFEDIREWWQGLIGYELPTSPITSFSILVLSVLISLLSFHVFENYFLRFKKYFETK